MYKVISRFADMLDSLHVYEVGDTYPRDGVQPTSERIEELKGEKNKIGKPLIEEVKNESKSVKKRKDLSKTE